MIRLYGRLEQNFNHNKNILSPLSCHVQEEGNGIFDLEIELPVTAVVEKGDVIKAPTPRGEQLFRVYRNTKTLKGKKYYAKHIFYDLGKNFVISVDANNIVANTAMSRVLQGTEYAHMYTGSSDVTGQKSAVFTRINPVQAIFGIINTWGGNLVRNNYNIQLKASGLDRGYEIRLGKNLIGIEDDSDESNVKTRLYPTVELGDKNIISLPEKYVDSPLLLNYGDPIIYEERIELTDDQKTLSVNDIYTIMRNHCTELFENYNVDKPIINYKIDFVELSKTEQYKELSILEKLDLYDIVTCNISKLNINVKAKVIKYRYDCLKERYETIELGDFNSVTKYQTDNMVKQLQQRIKANETAVRYATDMITGNKGGHVVILRYPDGKPFEILIMDTEDINTAADVFRLNKNGLGFSRNGFNGPYETAMTIDGHIVADFMDTGTLRAIDIEAVNIIGSIITGTEFHSAGKTSSTDIYDGFILTNSIGMQGNGYQSMHNTGSSLYGYGNLSTLINYAGLFTNGEVSCQNVETDFINSGAPITHLTIKDYKFPPETHNHDNDYALKQHAHDYAPTSHRHQDLEGAISNIHDILAQIWNTIHTYHP